MIVTGAAFVVSRDMGGETNRPTWTQWPWMLQYSGASQDIIPHTQILAISADKAFRTDRHTAVQHAFGR